MADASAWLKYQPMWTRADALIENSIIVHSFQEAACEVGIFPTVSEAESGLEEAIEN
jgi:hypothetical protein